MSEENPQTTEPTTETTTKPTTDHHEPTSNSDLMSSAKYVAEAAQLAATQQTDKIDKAKAAEAAEELIGAAKTYGKLDDKGVGQYLDKAEGYLHSMHSSESGGDATEKKEKESSDDGGAVGGIMKMAKGFF